MIHTISVTQQDIVAGLPASPDNCPIARAVRGALNQDVRVLIPSVEVCGRNCFPALPPEACEFIIRFDAGETVEPFEFELEVP